MSVRRCVSLAMTVLVIAVAAPVVGQDYPKVAAVSVSVGGPCTFVMNPGSPVDRDRRLSSSIVIEKTLLQALLSGANQVNLDLVPGSTVIQRVNAFGQGTTQPTLHGNYFVSRLATQRGADGRNEHLEVFLTDNTTSTEKAFNVYDPYLQEILTAAFLKPRRGPGPTPNLTVIDVYFDATGNDIVTVTLGEQYNGSTTHSAPKRTPRK